MKENYRLAQVVSLVVIILLAECSLVRSQKKEEEFGERAFGKKSFLVNTCKLQNVSDMHSFFKMAKSFLRSRPGAFDDYRNSIHRTFGREDDDLKERRIDYYRAAVKDGHAPYFFVNASMYSRELVDFSKSIEMTPEHIGNPVLGYGRWNDGAAINFVDSITIAAAGKPKVRNDVANFAPHTLCFKKDPSKDDDKDSLGRTACKRQPLSLWDGGKSENLGALPLIRRGIRNVIIVDAEHDPKYIYDAYFDLQRSLRAVSIDFCVPEIDGCGGEKPNSSTHQTGVMRGSARNKVTGAETTIFYLKMMRPLNVFPSAFHTFVMTSENAKERQARVKKEYEKGFKLYLEQKKKTEVSCEGAADLEADADVYRYRVNYYGYFILQSKLSWISYTDAVYDFPQTTTFDQSYYPDQMEAFIGLGFLQGNALSEEIGKLD